MFCYRCTNWFRSLGAITVWLSWISLVLFLRKFPKLGIYVVMFTHIMKTFAQFFTVFALFIVAFGLGFHMLLYEQVSPTFRSEAVVRSCSVTDHPWSTCALRGREGTGQKRTSIVFMTSFYCLKAFKGGGGIWKSSNLSVHTLCIGPKKLFLKILQNLCLFRSLFKKRLWHRYFQMNFANFLVNFLRFFGHFFL